MPLCWARNAEPQIIAVTNSIRLPVVSFFFIARISLFTSADLQRGNVRGGAGT